MRGKSGTRAIKNAKFIRAVSPDLFPTGEPQAGYASVVPFAVLDRFDRMSDEELRPYPQLRTAAKILRRKQRASKRRASSTLRRFLRRVLGWVFRFPPFDGTHQASGATPYSWWGSLLGWLFGWLFSSPPFSGTLHFLRILFTMGDTVVAMSDQDLATIIDYTNQAVQAIAAYTSQYGASPITVSKDILEHTVNLPSGVYSDDDLEQWIQLAIQPLFQSGETNFCIIVCNPEGVVNTDADPSKGVGGYHDAMPGADSKTDDEVRVPYCLVDVSGTGVTVQDRSEQYAKSLSHEIAEMIVDPEGIPWANPEVCDPCENAGTVGDGGGDPGWKAFFQVTAPAGDLRYVGSAVEVNEVTQPFDFYIAAVVQPRYTGNDNAPDWGCDYGPDDRTGINQLLFYERASGSSEIYSVDSSGNLALQTVQLRETEQTQNNVSLITLGHFMSRSGTDPVGEVDLFLYSPLDKNYTDMNGAGRFFQAGLLGEINPKDIETGLRTTWSLIIPGRFSENSLLPGATNDLLFYDPTTGDGAFYSTNNGLDQNFANSSGWNTTWSIIVAGKFSDNATDDLLFYDPTLGVGEFYHTNNGFDDLSFSSNTGWNTTWSIMVAGKFSASAAVPGGTDDLLFYDPTLGVGEFYHTNNGFDDLSFSSNTGWRTTWSIIIAGKFSDNFTDDLLFYDPTTGEAELHHTNNNGFDDFAFASFTGWRTTWSSIVPLSLSQS